MEPRVVSVAVSASHSFSKPPADAIELVAGFGVRGDAHGGPTVRHRSRVRKDTAAPNLRQVHLVHRELFDDFRPGRSGRSSRCEVSRRAPSPVRAVADGAVSVARGSAARGLGPGASPPGYPEA